MAKKEFPINVLNEAAKPKTSLSQISQAENIPKHIPTAAKKTAIIRSLQIYQEDLIILKMLIAKKYADNLSNGIDKKVSTVDLLEEAIECLKEKYSV